MLNNEINDQSLYAVDKNTLFLNNIIDSIIDKIKNTDKSNDSKKSITSASPKTIDSIVDDIYASGHNAWERLGNYYNTGNIEYIPEEMTDEDRLRAKGVIM